MWSHRAKQSKYTNDGRWNRNRWGEMQHTLSTCIKGPTDLLSDTLSEADVTHKSNLGLVTCEAYSWSFEEASMWLHNNGHSKLLLYQYQLAKSFLHKTRPGHNDPDHLEKIKNKIRSPD